MSVRRKFVLPVVLVVLVLGVGPGSAADEDTAARILGAALMEDGAYDKLTHLTDRIGHRLAGSETLERARIVAPEGGLTADTLDKVNRRDLDLNVAALAVLTYSLAEREETLPRLEPTEE